MNEATGQRTTRDLEAYRCFRIFGLFSGLPNVISSRRLCTVEGLCRSVRRFCFPRILKYRDYTIRRSNLIENEEAALIYGLPTLV